MSEEKQIQEKEIEDFNFADWITKYKLHDVEQCFIDHSMTTLDKLNMNNNPHFASLIADERIISNPSIIPKIIMAMQFLDQTRDKLQPKQQEHKEQPSGAEEKEHRLIFLSQKEQAGFLAIEKYLHRLDALEETLHNVTSARIASRKLQNAEHLESYVEYTQQTLNRMRERVDEVTKHSDTHITTQQTALHTRLDEYTAEIHKVHTSHASLVHNTSNVMDLALSTIDSNVTHLNGCVTKCEDTISAYQEKLADMASSEQHKGKSDYAMQRSVSTQREPEIVKIGKAAKQYYLRHLALVYENRDRLNDYIEAEVVLNMDNDLISAKVSGEVHRRIIADINRMVELKIVLPSDKWCGDEKMMESSTEEELQEMAEDESKHDVMSMDVDDSLPSGGPMAFNQHLASADGLDNESKLDDKSWSELEQEPPPVFNAIAPAAPRDVKHDENMKYGSRWCCAVCTFADNPGTFLTCKICNSSRQQSVQLYRHFSKSIAGNPLAPLDVPQSKSDFQGGVKGNREDSGYLAELSVGEGRKAISADVEFQPLKQLALKQPVDKGVPVQRAESEKSHKKKRSRRKSLFAWKGINKIAKQDKKGKPKNDKSAEQPEGL